MTDIEKKGPGRPPKKKSPYLSIADISDQFDPNSSNAAIRRQRRDPFADYPVKLLELRYYPRDKRLDDMGKDDLLEYCTKNSYLSKDWQVIRITPQVGKDQHERISEIRTDWDEERIRQFIDRKETHVIPSHFLVFTTFPPTKPKVPHAIALKSWITKRFRTIWFDLAWPLPSPDDPYLEGEPYKCAIVDDDSVRAQMFFVRQVKTGKVIPRQNGQNSAYFLLKDDAKESLPILERIYTNATRGSADLRLWEKEEGSLPSVD